MGSTCIYLDDETQETLKKLKREQPDFNLSGYVKTCVSENHGNQLKEEGILEHIKKSTFQENQAREAREHWEGTLTQLKEKQLLEASRDTKEQARKQNLAKIEDYLKDLGDNDEKMELFKKGRKEGLWSGVTEFAKCQIKDSDSTKSD